MSGLYRSGHGQGKNRQGPGMFMKFYFGSGKIDILKVYKGCKKQFGSQLKLIQSKINEKMLKNNQYKINRWKEQL